MSCPSAGRTNLPTIRSHLRDDIGLDSGNRHAANLTHLHNHNPIDDASSCALLGALLSHPRFTLDEAFSPRQFVPLFLEKKFETSTIASNVKRENHQLHQKCKSYSWEISRKYLNEPQLKLQLNSATKLTNYALVSSMPPATTAQIFALVLIAYNVWRTDFDKLLSDSDRDVCDLGPNPVRKSLHKLTLDDFHILAWYVTHFEALPGDLWLYEKRSQ